MFLLIFYVLWLEIARESYTILCYLKKNIIQNLRHQNNIFEMWYSLKNGDLETIIILKY